MEIPHYLIEAYLGRHELDDTPEARAEVVEEIRSHATHERLKVFLEWEGIIGYTDQILAILNISKEH